MSDPFFKFYEERSFYEDHTSFAISFYVDGMLYRNAYVSSQREIDIADIDTIRDHAESCLLDWAHLKIKSLLIG
jgi:hypothetical protein